MKYLWILLLLFVLFLSCKNENYYLMNQKKIEELKLNICKYISKNMNDINISNLKKIRNSLIKIDISGNSIIIIDENGNIIINRDNENTNILKLKDDNNIFYIKKCIEKKRSGFFTYKFEGKQKAISYININNSDYYIIIIIKKELLYRNININFPL
jgi:hypothetical protein